MKVKTYIHPGPFVFLATIGVGAIILIGTLGPTITKAMGF